MYSVHWYDLETFTVKFYEFVYKRNLLIRTILDPPNGACE